MLPMQVISNIQKDNGFTIVELVVTILIIGILSTTVAPRFFGTKSFENRKASDELLSALRYAQQLAMNRGGDIEFILNSNSFTVQRSTTEDKKLRSPDGVIPYTKIFPAGVTATAINTSDSVSITPPLQLNYTGLGQPINLSAMDHPLTAFSNEPRNFPTIQIKIGDFDINIESETGYAHKPQP